MASSAGKSPQQRNFTLRLAPSLHQRLTEIAEVEGMVRADLIQAVLREWVYGWEVRHGDEDRLAGRDHGVP
jgi:predicted HicB family RNase H-like nuclease